MKRVIRFSRGFLPAAIFSSALIVFGLVGLFTQGFNLGVDFQAGINQTVQLAYPAATFSYEGKGNAELKIGGEKLTIVFSGAEIEGKTVEFAFEAHPTIGSLVGAIDALPDLKAAVIDSADLPVALLVESFQGDRRLGANPLAIHRRPANEAESFADITKVRTALGGLGRISVQSLNPTSLQRFLVRVQDEGKDSAFSKNAAAAITGALEKSFGEGRVVVMKTDYVGARYSESLGRQSALMILFTVSVILLYAWIRFKFQFGMGAVLAILHDALIMVCFIIWTRMEFNTSTIAAILTILGYSINDTIVQFDRVREDRKLKPGDRFVDVLDTALSETLGRTIITTITTMLTVLALYFFTSGSIKDFALALFVGMVSGTYSTIFIASGFVNWWERKAEQRREAALALEAAGGVASAVKPRSSEKKTGKQE